MCVSPSSREPIVIIFSYCFSYKRTFKAPYRAFVSEGAGRALPPRKLGVRIQNKKINRWSLWSLCSHIPSSVHWLSKYHDRAMLTFLYSGANSNRLFPFLIYFIRVFLLSYILFPSTMDGQLPQKRT